MRLLILFTICFSIFSFQSNAQLGCTDPQANNFDENATGNDGSCLYNSTNYQAEEITQIPPPLTETSGLAFIEGELWTHLDGGNEDKLYQIDTLTGAILHSVIIVGADNVDWEDLAEDDTYLYIGDFGNNPGNRTDLTIFRIAKADLSQNSAIAQKIEFEYSDQVDFTSAPNANNYDCEAFFEFNDSLHLFSKNWTDFKTRHYVLPKEPGTHIAELRDSFLVGGQITAADISDSSEVVLMGYNVATSQAFFWLLFDFQGNDFFSGNKRKINLGNVLNISQPEGLTFSQNRSGFICSENISIFPQKLLKFSILDWVTNDINSIFDVPNNNLNFTVFPNPFQQDFGVKMKVPKKGKYRVSIHNNLGQLLQSDTLLLKKGKAEFKIELDDSTLSSGSYFLKISNENIRGGKVIIKK